MRLSLEILSLRYLDPVLIFLIPGISCVTVLTSSDQAGEAGHVTQEGAEAAHHSRAGTQSQDIDSEEEGKMIQK